MYLRAMTREEKIIFKDKLKQAARVIIEQRIVSAQQLMADAQQAANSEEKSSAGDKYETARAMGQLEKEMHARQLAEHLKDLGTLHAVNTYTLYEEATTGAFIQCTNIAFFIAAGLGKQSIDGQTILFLSPQAPLAKVLQHKKVNDAIVFNSVPTTIVALF